MLTAFYMTASFDAAAAASAMTAASRLLLDKMIYLALERGFALPRHITFVAAELGGQ